MDPSWEFQAPQFVDFTKLGTEDEQVIYNRQFGVLRRQVGVERRHHGFSEAKETCRSNEQ